MGIEYHATKRGPGILAIGGINEERYSVQATIEATVLQYFLAQGYTVGKEEHNPTKAKFFFQGGQQAFVRGTRRTCFVPITHVETTEWNEFDPEQRQRSHDYAERAPEKERSRFWVYFNAPGTLRVPGRRDHGIIVDEPESRGLRDRFLDYVVSRM